MRERWLLVSGQAKQVAVANDAIHVDLAGHAGPDAEMTNSDGLHLNRRGRARLAAKMIRRLHDRIVSDLR
jgi:hypothetical protein